MSEPGGTARGDRTQRRIDILDAATEILEESGWAGLNMREIAARAGVSAGATYQWFSGKGEIYANLFAARLDAGTELLRAVPADTGFDELLLGTFQWVAKTWNELGRWQLQFAEASQGDLDAPYLQTLRASHRTVVDTGMEQLARAAASEGTTLDPDPATANLIWGMATGLATRAAVLGMPDADIDALQRSAVRVLSAGLVQRG